MLCVPMNVLWTVTLFLEETSKSLGAATAVHCIEVQVLPGKRGTVSKPKQERSRDWEVSGIACVKRLR